MSELRAGLVREMTEILASQSQPRLFDVSNDLTETTLWSLDQLSILKITGGEKSQIKGRIGGEGLRFSFARCSLRVGLLLELESSAGAASWCWE